MSRLSQRERIARARGAYIIPINSARSRFQVYLLGNNGIELLYPDSENKKDRLHYQRVQTVDPSKPISCFALGGGGYSKTDAIARELREYNSDLQVEVLSIGFSVAPMRAKAPSSRHLDEFESGMYADDVLNPSGKVDRDKFRLYSVVAEFGAVFKLERGENDKFEASWTVIDMPENTDAEIAKARSWEDAERIANKLVGQVLQMVEYSGPVYTGELNP